jgi:hypothetical protein
MRSKPSLWLAAPALLLATAVPMLGQPRPVGNEFRVNSVTVSKQHNPVAAFNAAGDSLVVWENDQDGLRGRFYAPDGSALTAELGLVANQVLTTVPSQGTQIIRKDPAVAFLPSGEFLLAWTEEQQYVIVDLFIQNTQVIDRDVYLQKFTAAGAPEGSPVRLNTTTAGFQSLPKILVRRNADAVVVWQSDDQKPTSTGDGIFGRLVHTGNATPSSAEMKLSSIPGLAANASIAAGVNGNFIVAWEAPDSNALGVYARLFNRNAVPKATEFRVNTTVLGLQRRPSVSFDANTNGWLVVWQGQAGTIKDAHVYGQFLGATGTLTGSQVQISQGIAQAEIAPSVAPIAGGHYLVTWVEYQDIFPVGLYGVEVDRLGAEVGSEVEINSQPINTQTRTAIAVSASGDVLVPWEGFTASPDAPVISARLVDF